MSRRPAASRRAALLAEARRHHAAGRLPEAEASCRRLLESDPGHPDANHLMGVAASAGGRHLDALAFLGRALRADPRRSVVHTALGLALDALGRADEALAAHRAASSLDPGGAVPLNNLGVVLRAAGRARAAAGPLRRAAALAPGVPEIHVNLGNALADLREFGAAADALRAAAALRPGMAQAHSDLGNVLREAGSLDAALEAGRRAVSLDPGRAESVNNLGVTLARLGQMGEAVSCYRSAIALSPMYPDAHANLGMSLLARGEAEEGWREFEWRWRTPAMARHARAFAEPPWRGGPGGGRTLLIHAEQGLGDAIQFCRLAASAADLGWQVVLEVPPPLVRLLSSLAGPSLVVPRGAPLPPFDAHCAMLSLPAALGLGLRPGGRPYLKAAPGLSASWEARFARHAGQAPRVGVAWAGNPALPRDAERSLPGWALRRLLATPGIAFVSLQRDVRPPDGVQGMLDPLRDAEDLADTAAVVSCLDLVISVDTAAAHLAGAMGVPVLLLDRFAHCWRWPEGAMSTPWYPSMTILRQPAPGAWDGPLESASAILRGLRRGPGPRPTERTPPSMPDTAPALVPPPAALGRIRPCTGGPRNIVAFVGQNENGILREASAAFMAFAEPAGYACHVVDLNEADWLDGFRRLVDEGILLAWGAAGIGAALASDGIPLWDAIRVPFISVMSDSVCWRPMNHRIDARFVANGYMFQDWLDMQAALVRSPQISSLLPLGALPNPHRDAAPWSRRGNRMLFVKTGCDPESHRAAWTAFPPRFRTVMEEASAAALAAPVGDILPFLLNAVQASGLRLEGRPDVLFGLLEQVDRYVRDARSTAVARALLPLPVDVVGRGWDHLASLPGRARFSPAVPASALPGIYADTQFLLNTMPNFSHRTHERVLAGFAARCCVVTDENPDMRARFSELPTYVPMDTRSSALAEVLADVHATTESFEGQGDPALAMLAADFPPDAFMAGLIDLAAEVSVAASAYFAEHAFALPAPGGPAQSQ